METIVSPFSAEFTFKSEKMYNLRSTLYNFSHPVREWFKFIIVIAFARVQNQNISRLASAS